ncbi:MAG TPA: tetratricopeptide repeat protein [Cyclobacteriaceae bacterium]|jgi:TolA-binding protein|nr:tetratricopeptide repeat protein [Cytophagales bacterium]HRE65954.1 tetratricopeptide repeat protein [Cyclobacteriaceae bacterium]HRF33926.1 tetratricopeptide repeat protein [Cyclobacteriaceae bacterium]
MAKKEEKKDALENVEVLQEKLIGIEGWFEKNPKTAIGIAAAILLVVGGYFGYRYYINSQDDLAQSEMFQAVRYFESDSLNLALNGDGNNLGFLQIVEDYSGTKAGNLANYYAGVIYLKQGKFPLAIFHLEDFSSNDLLVQARAYSLTGDAYMEQDNFESAAKYYAKAASYKPNKEFTPTYLMKAALAYEKLNQNDKAKAAYQTIIDEFWESSEYQNARKFKARLESNS